MNVIDKINKLVHDGKINDASKMISANLPKIDRVKHALFAISLEPCKMNEITTKAVNIAKEYLVNPEIKSEAAKLSDDLVKNAHAMGRLVASRGGIGLKEQIIYAAICALNNIIVYDEEESIEVTHAVAYAVCFFGTEKGRKEKATAIINDGINRIQNH